MPVFRTCRWCCDMADFKQTTLTTNQKNRPFGLWLETEARISHTTTPTPPYYEVGGIGKRIKTARLRRKTNPVGT